MATVVGKLVYLFGFLLAFVLLVLGILSIRRYGKSKQLANMCLNWPTVLGRIVRSEVEKSGLGGKNGTSFTYTPHVEYLFELQDHEYCGDRLIIFDSVGTPSAKTAQLVVDKYPVDGSVSVYYNPDNPNEAVLEQCAGTEPKGPLVGGIILGLVGVLLAVLLLISWLG